MDSFTEDLAWSFISCVFLPIYPATVTFVCLKQAANEVWTFLVYFTVYFIYFAFLVQVVSENASTCGNTKNSCRTEAEPYCRYVVWRKLYSNLKLNILHTCKTFQRWKHDQMLCFSFSLTCTNSEMLSCKAGNIQSVLMKWTRNDINFIL